MLVQSKDKVPTIIIQHQKDEQITHGFFNFPEGMSERDKEDYMIRMLEALLIQLKKLHAEDKVSTFTTKYIKKNRAD